MAFNTGDSATGSQALTAEIQIDAEWVTLCMSGLDEAMNYMTETTTDLCSGGVSSTSTTGIDPEWSGEGVVRYGGGIALLLEAQYDLTKLNNIPFRVTNTLLNRVVTIPVAITSMDLSGQATESIKATLAFKPFTGAPEITPIVPIP